MRTLLLLLALTGVCTSSPAQAPKRKKAWTRVTLDSTFKVSFPHKPFYTKERLVKTYMAGLPRYKRVAALIIPSASSSLYDEMGLERVYNQLIKNMEIKPFRSDTFSLQDREIWGREIYYRTASDGDTVFQASRLVLLKNNLYLFTYISQDSIPRKEADKDRFFSSIQLARYIKPSEQVKRKIRKFSPVEPDFLYPELKEPERRPRSSLRIFLRATSIVISLILGVTYLARRKRD